MNITWWRINAVFDGNISRADKFDHPMICHPLSLLTYTCHLDVPTQISSFCLIGICGFGKISLVKYTLRLMGSNCNKCIEFTIYAYRAHGISHRLSACIFSITRHRDQSYWEWLNSTKLHSATNCKASVHIDVWNAFITVTSHKRHDVWNHRQRHCLLISLFRITTTETSKFALLAVWKGIHQWTVNSSHNEPLLRKAFLYPDVIILINIYWNLLMNLFLF